MAALMASSFAGSSPLTRGKPRTGSTRLMTRGLIPAHAGKTSPSVKSLSPERAHPRSRGENPKRAWTTSTATGSSPLTRGKPLRTRLGPRGGGLIPAHAGKTEGGLPKNSPGQAHPRSRGENFATLACAGVRGGSSPLTRGKPAGGGGAQEARGLIPAHAGKTRGVVGRRMSQGAHPRSRGENRERGLKGCASLGSSPLTRGKQQIADRLPRPPGLIPAHAGKTCSSPRCRARARAHPRSRGENGGSSSPQRLQVGSSPLTRGKPKQLNIGAPAPRLIPAHAGKTAPGACSGLQGAAHPRSRGENRLRWCRWALVVGSSPLTRGKQPNYRDVLSREGLIPAHAGKTAAGVASFCQVGAHPRSRGENACSRPARRAGRGSSPLTRGKHQHARELGVLVGLIPAHAGKT